MSLTYNGTEPTVITYNGSDVETVIYNGTTVWTKPSAGYTLTWSGIKSGRVEFNGSVITSPFTLTTSGTIEIEGFFTSLIINGTTYDDGSIISLSNTNITIASGGEAPFYTDLVINYTAT